MSEDTGFECPRCGKKGFVRLHSDGDVFECLYCYYWEDLSRRGWRFGTSGLAAVILAIFIALALLG